MPIEFICSGCGNTLRVSDEQAGRQAKCPNCDQLTTIPFASVVPEIVGESEGLHPAAPIGPSATTSEGAALRPHRGGTILIFGVFSILCCGLLGIAAWIMANEDLSLMDRGVMDPSGRGMTMAGKVLGIIALVILVLAIIGQVTLNA